MTQYLPPNLLALFAPRDPIRYLPPAQKLVIEKKTDGYEGVGRYLGFFEVKKNMFFITFTRLLVVPNNLKHLTLPCNVHQAIFVVTAN